MDSTKQPQKWLKKILKFLLWMLGIFVGFILLIYLALIILFPSEKLKQIAKDELATALNRRVEIKRVRFNLFKGIEIDHFTIHESDSLLHEYDSLHSQFISVKKIVLRYKLFPLLKRRLLIEDILIESPEIHVFSDQEGRFNFDDIIASQVPPTADTTVEAAAEVSLPISIDLKQFELQDFSFTLDMLQDTTTFRASLARLNGRVRELFVPRGVQENILQNVRLKTEIITDKAQLKTIYTSRIDTVAVQLASTINMNIEVDVKGIQRIEVEGELTLEQSQLSLIFEPEPTFPTNPPNISNLASVKFKMLSDMQSGTIDFQNINTYLGNQLVFSAKGYLRNAFEQPFIELQIEESRLYIDTLMALIHQIAPPEIRSQLDEIEMTGTLSLSGTHIQGNPIGLTRADGLEFSSQLEIDHLNLNYEQELSQVKDLKLTLTANGNYSEAGLADMAFDMIIQSPILILNPEDTLEISGKNLTVTLHSKLADNLFPSMAKITGKIEDIFDSFINFQLNMNSSGSFDDFEANGTVEISNVHLEAIIPSGIAGIMNSEISLFSNSLDRIELDLVTNLDSLMLELESGWENIESLNLTGLMNISTDSSLANFYVAPSRFDLNDFLTFYLQGKVLEYGEKGFGFEITDAVLDHRRAFARIPESQKEGIESLEISGESHLTASITGDIPAVGEAHFNMDAFVTNESVNLEIPELFLIANEIKTESRFLISPENMKINASAGIGEFWLTDIRQIPIRNTSFLLEAEMPLFERMDILSSALNIPDLNSIITATGTIDSLQQDEIVLNLSLDLDFSSDNLITIIDDVMFSGNASANASLYMKNNLLSATGELILNKLNANYIDSIEIWGIEGKIPFTQKVDVVALSLIDEDITYTSSTKPTNMSYIYMQPYYEHLIPPMPQMRIDKINVIGYEMTNFISAILVGGGKLEVPNFTLKLFDGNVTGNFGIDLGEETFDDPDLLLDSTRFHLKATFSSLNSAKLNPAISANVNVEKSKINANMDLKGNGLNPDGNFEVTGYFYITDIGPRVADNFLRLLTPNDVLGIGVVRSLIRNGFKPELMSFEIKHSHFYPKFSLSQPWYFPLKIKGRKIELARMPIKLFLKQMMTPSFEGD